MKTYGKELVLDLHNCNPQSFNRKSIRNYFNQLCKLIDMEQCKLVWWDDLYSEENEKETEPHLVGTSAVQFIKTSNITLHSLDLLQKVFINIFSCKNFDSRKAVSFSAKWFSGTVKKKTIIGRT